jgi:hypothetical protein
LTDDIPTDDPTLDGRLGRLADALDAAARRLADLAAQVAACLAVVREALGDVGAILDDDDDPEPTEEPLP